MPDSAELRLNIPKLYLFKFLLGLHFFAGVLIPFFTQWGGISMMQVMWLQSWFVGWIFILQAPTGAFADTLGRKVSLMAGAVCISLAALLYQSKADFRVFLAAEFLWALSQSFVSGADQALGYDTLKALGEESRSKEVFGRAASFNTGGIMVAAPIGSLLAARYGLRAPVLCMSAFYALGLLVAWTFVEPPHDREPTRRYWGVMVEGMRAFVGNPVLRGLAFDSVTIFVLSFMMVWLYQPALAALGVPISVFGFVTTAFTGTEIVLMNNFQRLEAWCGGKKRFLLLSGAVPGVAYIVVALTHTPAVAIVGMVAITSLGLSRVVLIDNYMNKHIESDKRASVLSSIAMSQQLLQGSVYPIVGWLAKTSLQTTMLALGVTALLCSWASNVQEQHLAD